jgi:hypothetical protein
MAEPGAREAPPQRLRYHEWRWPVKLSLVVAVFALILGCATPVKSPVEPPLLARMVSADESVRAEAQTEWNAHDDEARFRLLLGGLRSEHREVAWSCADRLDPWRLNLDELRLRSSILAQYPDRYFLPGHEGKAHLLSGLGAPEIPSLLRHFAKLRIEDPFAFRDSSKHTSRASQFQNLHRVMSSNHLPVLVSVLPAEDPAVFRELLSLLHTMARFSTEHRDLVARGFLYGLARLEAEKAGELAKPLEGFVVDTPDSGLSDAFLTIAQGAFLPEPRPTSPPQAPRPFSPQSRWTLRWARELRASARNVPFLLEVARRGWCLAPQVWAVNELVRLSDPRSQEFIASTAAGASDLAPFAAAALARQGNRVPLTAILHRPDVASHACILALDALPDLRHEVPQGDFWRSSSYLARFEAEFGIAVPSCLFGRAIRAAVRAEPSGDRIEPYYVAEFSEYVPDTMLQMLGDAVTPGNYKIDGTWDRPFLGLLEVRAPVQLKRILLSAADSPASEFEEDRPLRALRLLARLGDTSRVDATIEQLPAMLESGFYYEPNAETDLGDLANARLAEAMRERLGADDPEEAVAAFWALCVMGGADSRMLPVHTYSEPDLSTGPWSLLLAMVLDGDAIGALVELNSTEPTEEMPWLGLSHDPRVVALFQRLRKQRIAYWPATAGLALTGDADAKRELLAFFRERRAILVSDMEALLLPGMESDSGLIETAIDRLGENCCAACEAAWALAQRYPSLDTEYDISALPEIRRRIRAWYERNRSRLVWSRIGDGYIPQ